MEFSDMPHPKMISADCKLVRNDSINRDIFRLVFAWQGTGQMKYPAPKAGQFFMIKPKRGSVFLGRPISAAKWQAGTLTFLIALRGRGTEELAQINTGEKAVLTGPLGKAWMDFLPPVNKGAKKHIALVGGGIGLAPLNALLYESPGHVFDLYAGFKKSIKSIKEKNAFLDPDITGIRKIILVSEDGKTGQKGFVTDFFEPEKYDAVCACGPEPMLKSVAVKCRNAGVPCFVSLERRMACGVGACLGCTVKTVSGNRRCCADGPIFNAQEVFFDE
ncbi:MAG: dihydroorotate dehydrogenase electron transfer subunit [Treponema sp.]|nr:dihydroorotate dehydrogenase electron transfer subunit [Treponema sp.]